MSLLNLVLTKPFFEDRKEKRETKLRRRKREASDIRTWIRARTSGTCFGKQIVNKEGQRHPIHCNKNMCVKRFYHALFHGFKPSPFSRWTNRDFDLHQISKATFFFAGASEFEKQQTLVNIDIDCKKFGTLDGATAFAKWIQKNIFPNMYFEVSTNGNGIHGYIILDKGELGSEAVNRLLLNRLDKFLKLCLAETDFDVENVEIKGTLPTYSWGDQKYDLAEYKSGVLAKLPRLGSKKKEKAMRDTTHISVTDLQSDQLFKLLKSSGNNERCSSLSVSHSSSGIPISEEELNSLEDYVAVAEQLLDGQSLRTSSRHVVNSTDVAIFLMLGKCFTENMNKDGSMPSERFSSVWTKITNL